MRAVITGATSGIGKAMACQLAQNGWSLVLTGRNQTVLEQLYRNQFAGRNGFVGGQCASTAYLDETLFKEVSGSETRSNFECCFECGIFDRAIAVLLLCLEKLCRAVFFGDCRGTPPAA